MSESKPVLPRLSAREAATAVAMDLRQSGYEALFAGGCVRDRLMGTEPDDYDVVTNARPEQVREVFPRAYGVGAAFGVMLVRRAGHVIEVATYRTDGAYSDSRRPDHVEFADANADAQRRDFTINGLFEDPATGEVIDYVGGRQDLASGVIRAIGDPVQRLHEDRLRMIRAVRFAARFGFRIESNTLEAIRRGASDLSGISRERVGHELRRMFGHTSRANAATMLQHLGLDSSVLTEERVSAPLPRLAALAPEAEFGVCLAAWMLDRSREIASTEARVRLWSSALILTNNEQKLLDSTLVTYLKASIDWIGMKTAQRKRLWLRPEFSSAITMLGAVNPEVAATIAEDASKYRTDGLATTPIISGDDLVSLGFTPGPRFRTTLEQLYDAQLEGRIKTRDEAMELAESLMKPGK